LIQLTNPEFEKSFKMPATSMVIPRRKPRSKIATGAEREPPHRGGLETASTIFAGHTPTKPIARIFFGRWVVGLLPVYGLNQPSGHNPTTPSPNKQHKAPPSYL